MSVIYERTMAMNYDIALSPKEWAMVSSDLHDQGMNFVSRYKWSTDINAGMYGNRTIDSESTIYTIVIDGQRALTTQYSTDATKMINQLKENTNFEIERIQDTTVTTETKWVTPSGEYFLLNYEDLVGIQKIGVTPELHYPINEDVTMVTTLTNKSNIEVELKFIIRWETDGVQTKRVIEEMCVNTPLPDIGSIQYIVENVMRNYTSIGEPIIECFFDAKTESRSECTPDIIAKTREARLAARNKGEDE